MLGFDFESDPLCAALKLFERMEFKEVIYEGSGEPTQTKQPRAYSKRVSGRKKTGIIICLVFSFREETRSLAQEKIYVHRSNS